SHLTGGDKLAVRKIALVTNFNIREKAQTAARVADFISAYPCEIYVSDLMREKAEKFTSIAEKVIFAPHSTIYRDMDAIIVLGGDGSILSAARYCISSKIPILGINLGHLGYMAEMEVDEIDMLDRLFTGNYEIEERIMLDVSVLRKGKNLVNRASALNDAVISNGSVSRMIDVELSEGDLLVSSYRADGLIFATPTGSTAYSMSAGGPVIDPRMGCICVTPVCPHSLAARPLVFSDSAELSVKNTCDREKSLFLTLDGKVNFEIYRGDVVRIKRSNSVTKLIKLKDRGFYNTLNQKMNKGK
ncbi:MAG: NAD(+)/NADH kinase, partial [Clostridia bacterium]|nr:NAD(+)/NADH kinase [Clostridia bacterium]